MLDAPHAPCYIGFIMMIGTIPLPEGCVRACQACRHRQWTMEQSLQQKHAYLATALAPWADKLLPVQSVPEAGRLHYRDKIKLSARCYDGRWEFGMEPRDEFVPIPRCPVQTSRVSRTLAILGRHLPRCEKLPLRYVVQNGALVTLVIKARTLASTDWVTPELTGSLQEAGVSGLHVNLHPATGRILFAEKGWQCLWGAGHVQDERGLWHGPGALGQLLPSLHEGSLDVAGTFLQIQPDQPVVDLYTGIGASLRRWTARSTKVIGVEFDGDAIDCAGRNAPAAKLLRGPCAQRLPQVQQWLEDLGRPLHAAYVNPPRTGLEDEVTRWLLRSGQPARLAHLSCSAGTLCRDLEQLTAGAYTVEALHPFDFFPQTHHVEVLALLRHRQA